MTMTEEDELKVDDKISPNGFLVYKSCQTEWIVVLEPLKDTITNMNRRSVVDDRYAKFRGNKFKVVKIEHKLDPTKTVDEIENSIYGKKIVYKVGEIVEVEDYDQDIENICASGIHFYKTKEGAYWGEPIRIENGTFEVYHGNGQIGVKCTYGNGTIDGEHVSYYDNGQINKKCNYVNGKIDGGYVSYYDNGQIEIKCSYDNGNIYDEYVSYHGNGQIGIKCNYVYGDPYGEYVSYHGNGQIGIKCNYDNGKRNGEYVSYHENGRIEIKCYYVTCETKFLP